MPCVFPSLSARSRRCGRREIDPGFKNAEPGEDDDERRGVCRFSGVGAGEVASCILADSPMETIRIRGARTHNLRNVNIDIPRNKLVVVTGLSGSGKSSLAFDTLYAEGQRRYVESLSAYARQFLQLMEKPDVDLIEGLSPAI